MAESVIEKATTAGTVVAGGVYNVATPPAGDVGTFAGYTAPGKPAVISGTAGGGILQPEQSRQFIDYLWDNMVLSKEGRRLVLRANTAELNKIGVGERVIRAAAQADQTYTNAQVSFTKIELTTRKVRLDWEISTEGLEDNIEGSALEDHIARDMTAQFAADLEDLAINAVTGADPFLGILGTNGFLKQYQTALGASVVEIPASISVETYQALIKAIPRKFRGVKRDLRFYASSNAFTETINKLGAAGNLTAEQLRVRVVDGVAPQVLGDPVRYSILGVPLQEVPLLGADGSNVVLLTFPQNNIWGFQRDITVHNEFKPKKDTVEYTVYARFGIAIEETNAASLALDLVTP